MAEVAAGFADARRAGLVLPAMQAHGEPDQAIADQRRRANRIAARRRIRPWRDQQQVARAEARCRALGLETELPGLGQPLDCGVIEPALERKGERQRLVGGRRPGLVDRQPQRRAELVQPVRPCRCGVGVGTFQRDEFIGAAIQQRVAKLFAARAEVGIATVAEREHAEAAAIELAGGDLLHEAPRRFGQFTLSGGGDDQQCLAVARQCLR